MCAKETKFGRLPEVVLGLMITFPCRRSGHITGFFFLHGMAPSFETKGGPPVFEKPARHLPRQGRVFLDHPYAPRHSPSAAPTEKLMGVVSYTTIIRREVVLNIFYNSLIDLCVICH